MDILQQIKQRRLEMGIQQKDMLLRIGMNRQQYQRLEANGNPRLDTLELIAKGLDAELLLIPNEYIRTIKELLKSKAQKSKQASGTVKLSDDPWKEHLG